MAEKKIIEVGADVGDALKEIKNLFNTMVEEEKKAQKQTEETTQAVKDIGKASKSTQKEVKSISKGFKGLGLAMKAAGIGLVISAFQGLKDIMSQNQRVVDIFSTAFETASIVINQVVTALFNVYDAVSKTSENFNGLGKVLSGLLTLAITPLKLSFFAIKLGLQEAQLAWEQSFFGDKNPETIKTLNASISETKTRLAEVGAEALKAGSDVVTNFGVAVGEVANIGKIAGEELSKVSVKAAYEQAKVNVELKNTAEIAAAQQSRLVEQYDRQAEQLRQIRDEERNSIEVRRKANDDLLITLAEQEKAMLKQADLQIASAQNEKEKNNTVEAQVALIDALANKEAILAQIEGFRSEQKANDLALDKEQIELNKTKLESESKLSIEQKRFNAEQIEDELLRLEKLKEIDELEAEQEAVRLQAIVNNANAGTQAKVDAQIALDEFIEQSRQTNITGEKEIAEEEKKIEQQKIASKQAALNSIISIAGAETRVGQALFAAKQILAFKETLADIKRITFRGTQAIAESKVATSQNVANASKIGFPQNIITIAGAIAQGVSIISSVKKAVSQTKANVSDGGAASSLSNISSPSQPTQAQAQAPSFNIVGQGGSNQLAEAIGSQESKPIKAYVSSNDVTTAQGLERNIVEGATI